MDDTTRKEIQELSEKIARLETTVKIMGKGLEPILVEFKQATKDLIELQNEQKRIVGVNLDEVIDNRMLQQFEETYKDKVKVIITSSLEAFHNNIRWKVVTTIVSAFLATLLALVGLIKW